MTKTYVTQPSENFAERAEQVGDYHPGLCFKMGQTHAAYGWSPVRRGEWDDAQWAAYQAGYKENS